MSHWRSRTGCFTIHGLKIEHRQDRSAAHKLSEGRTGHRAGGEETNSGGQCRVPRRGLCAKMGRRRER